MRTRRRRPAPVRARLAVGISVTLLAVGLASCGGKSGARDPVPAPDENTSPASLLMPDDVSAIMTTAAGALPEPLAVAVTDRRGVILGVATTFGMSADTYRASCVDPLTCPLTDTPADSDCAVVNRAVQLARTAAFFSSNQTPLTSRSVRFLSGEHFPPHIRNTGAAALFGIENTNRGCAFDAAFDAGADFISEAKIVPRAKSLVAGFDDTLRCENGAAPGAQCGCTAGIATLPGGVPIFKSGNMAGGVGVAIRGVVPASDPVAAFDEPDVVLRKDDGNPAYTRAEFAARAFAGDNVGFPALVPKGLKPLCQTAHAPPCCGAGCDFNILPGRPPFPFDPVIFVDGIEIPEVEANPPVGGPSSPTISLVIGPTDATTPAAAPVASQWLVGPNPSTPGAAQLSDADVSSIIGGALNEANRIRAAIRLPFEARTAMVLAISDTNGALIGLYRMPDATVFSIDVAVAKSRNVIYFSSPTIDPIDTRDNPSVNIDLGRAFAPGTAITNRTISFSSQPFFPSGIEGSLAGFPNPFAPGPFRRVFVEDSALPCTNGRQPINGRQNGIVFFPGSAPLYRDGALVGGFGVSGDGVEQDDLVTLAGTNASPGFQAPDAIRADQVLVRGVRLPYLKGNRQPSQ